VIAIVWFAAGLVIGVAACWFAPRLLPAARAAGSTRAPWVIAGGLAVAFAVAATILHFAISSRRNLADNAPHAVAATAPNSAASASSSAQSMQAAVAGLEARLASAGGTNTDWELLAKAYEFLGRADDAQRARAHVASPASDLTQGQGSAMSVETLMAAAAAAGSATGPTTASPPTAAPAPSPAPTAATLEELRRRVHDRPGDAPAWLALAERYRELRDNPAARDALAKVVALHGMTAQSWADYADVLASLTRGSLTGAAGSAIDQALAIDPANPKALWLKASQAHEQHHFAEALGWWRKLRAVLPADSPDARIIDGNIAEDTQLGGVAPATVEVSGTVSIDSHLAGRVQPDATLFIYAKAADSPGPPLAVLRTAAAGWPVRFRLDDSMAMLPSRRLSQFDKVVIEARISRSGQATPGSGDLYVTSPAMNPGAGQRLALVINREID
jgi:cytochrome c-type biogenesis protein CcmH